MKIKSVLIFILCFAVSGEVLIRLTEHFKILESNRVQKIDIAIESSDELDLYQANQIDLSDSSLRILVIGDSYIHGGGIMPDKKMSNQLRRTINQDNNKYKNIYILDVSKPDANNLDNLKTYLEYKDFSPQIVILGYHFNDINGNLDDVIKVDSIPGQKSNVKTSSGSQSKMFIRKVTNFLYHSAILEYAMPKFNNMMLSKGYIIPNSRLHNTLKYYEQDHETWKKSKNILSQMISDIQENGSKLIVYHFAYTNLIEYPQLFDKSSTSIEQFFKSFDHVNYISGIEHFKGEKASDYFIYKHDGHPNAKAHSLIARKIDDTIGHMIKDGFVDD
jgi:lysophospholipase L1-like esterase